MRTKARFMVPVLARRGVNLPTNVSVPAAPTNFVATAAGPDQIDWTWDDNASNETGYRVERSPNGTDSWVTVDDTLPPNSDSGFESDLATGTEYFYRAFAFNATGDSAPSNVDSATTTLTTLLYDTFDEESLTELASHTPNIDHNGNGWVENVGDWEVSGGGGYCYQTGTYGSQTYANCDVEESDCVIVFNGRFAGGNPGDRCSAGISFRFTDGNNRYLATVSTFSTNPWTWAIIKYEGGSGSTLASAQGVSGASDDVQREMTITLSGNSIRLEVPDEGIDLSTSNSFNNSETAHGLYSNRGSVAAPASNLIEDITITEIP